MHKIIDGKAIASQILDELREKIALFPHKIGLAFLIIGDNPASQAYVRMKRKACQKIGIHSIVQEHPAHVTTETLLSEIDLLNRDPAINGILVQLPLPHHLNAQLITRSIAVEKDVDGFHPVNLGKLLLGEEGGFVPCTPFGIQVLLLRSNISVDGKHVVIVGRSNIVGKPLAALLMQKKKGCNATVTIAHSQSERLIEITQSADVLVAAMGQPLFIRKNMVKRGCIVIDVGINRLNNQIVGDVDFEDVAHVASRITPVPGGVGPMTIALLMQNTYESAIRTHGLL